MKPTKGRFKKRMRFAWVYNASYVTLKSVARHTKVCHMTMRSKLQLIKDVKPARNYMTDCHIDMFAAELRIVAQLAAEFEARKLIGKGPNRRGFVCFSTPRGPDSLYDRFHNHPVQNQDKLVVPKWGDIH